jgi:parallel beta-helix repeat protein
MFVDNNKVINNTTHKSDLVGIYIAGDSSLGIGDNPDTRIHTMTVTNNQVDGVNRDGIYTSDTYNNFVFSNKVSNVGRMGITTLRGYNQRVMGNFVENANNRGIRLQWCSYNVCTGNILKKVALTGSFGITMNRTRFSVVSSNIIDTAVEPISITEVPTDANTIFATEHNLISENIFVNNKTIVDTSSDPASNIKINNI